MWSRLTIANKSGKFWSRQLWGCLQLHARGCSTKYYQYMSAICTISKLAEIMTSSNLNLLKIRATIKYMIDCCRKWKKTVKAISSLPNWYKHPKWETYFKSIFLIHTWGHNPASTSSIRQLCYGEQCLITVRDCGRITTQFDCWTSSKKSKLIIITNYVN